jgi:hypothetical protein
MIRRRSPMWLSIFSGRADATFPEIADHELRNPGSTNHPARSHDQAAFLRGSSCSRDSSPYVSSITKRRVSSMS